MSQGKKIKANDIIGVEFTTNEEYQVIIIDYVNYDKVQVMFLDEHKHKTWTKLQHLKNGNLKNPFHKSVFGIGYLGTDENGKMPKCVVNGKNTREYNCWSHMLERCYDERYHERQPTYKNCTVCDRWHNYSLFLEDLPKIKGYELWINGKPREYDLNKDIYYGDLGIDTDCKEYSLETCQFISKKENIIEMRKRVSRK